MDDDTALRGGTAYELGRLHGRITALETRVDKQESLLAGIDAKLDSVLLVLATAAGGGAKMTAFVKVALAVVGALGSFTVFLAAAYHFMTGAR